MTSGVAPCYETSALDALHNAYERDENDEFVQATTIIGEDGLPKGLVRDSDTVICANFRPDRSREITRAFVDTRFDGFVRSATPKLSDYVMMTELDVPESQ